MTCPPLPSLEKLKAFRSDQNAVSIARKLKADIRRAADSVALEALYAAAAHRFPDDAPVQALQKFGLETMALITELTRLTDDARSVQAAERARLEPLKRAATKRMFACIERLARIPSLIKIAASPAQERRASLVALGINDPATLDQLAPEAGNPAALEAEKCSLEAEITRIETFLRTGDESIMPVGVEPFDQAAVDAARRAEREANLRQATQGFEL